MDGEYLLDTNVIIAFFGGDKEIGLKIREAEKLFILRLFKNGWDF